MEPRLALTWGAVPPSAILPPAAATAIALDAQNDSAGWASVATTEVDYFAFTATASGTYTISATTPTSSLDTVLGVFSASGARLAYNDDISAANTDSRLSVHLTAGARYYVGVTNYASWSRGAYAWSIDGPAPAAAPAPVPTPVPPALADDAYENNDSQATAYDLGTVSGARTVSNLRMADSQDWFRFTTTAAGTSANSVAISFQHSQGDVDLALYSAAGTLIGVSQGTGNSETLSLAGLGAGTYFVRAYGYAGATNPAYSLTFQAPTPPPVVPPAVPNSPVTVFPDVPNFGGSNDWNLNLMNAPEAWARGYTGQGTIVAVVDTGVDLNHPDLVNQLWVNPGEIAGNGLDDDHNGFVDDRSGWDFASGDNNPDDGNGHGTHVAGTIAAANNGVGATGVAPGARIMPVRVLDSRGSGTDSAVAAGIRYAAQNGADIINLSLGGGFSTVIQTAIQYARQLNVLVVVAAGNESGAAPSYPARFSASLDNVISVGAHSSSNGIAAFSNHVGASGAVQVDAPGVGIYSTYIDGRYAALSGTSMATPHVAGLAALALSANPGLTASQLRTLIVNGANRAIAGSDGRGGVNAAVTVALAASGQVSSSTSNGATTQNAVARQSASAFWLGSRSVVGDAAGAPLADAALVSLVAQSEASTLHSAPSARLSEVSPPVRDQALLAWCDEDEAAPAGRRRGDDTGDATRAEDRSAWRTRAALARRGQPAGEGRAWADDVDCEDGLAVGAALADWLS